MGATVAVVQAPTAVTVMSTTGGGAAAVAALVAALVVADVVDAALFAHARRGTIHGHMITVVSLGFILCLRRRLLERAGGVRRADLYRHRSPTVPLRLLAGAPEARS